MWNPLKWYKALETGIAKGWVNLFYKNGKAYKAVEPAWRGGAVMAATVKAKAAVRGIFASTGVVVGGWLGYLGINWTGKKADDATASLGFLVIVASLTAIGVGATLVLRKK